MRVRLSKHTLWSASHRARRVLIAAGTIGATGVLATVALASSSVSSASVNWSTVTSASRGRRHAALVAAAKAEGTLNVIALPSNWANYGKEISTFEKKYGIKINSENPERHERSGDPGDQDHAGRSSAPDVVDVGGEFASAGASTSLFAPYKVETWKDIPAPQRPPTATGTTTTADTSRSAAT